MAKNKQYSIFFRGLNEGRYEYEFVINKEFVELFSITDFGDASITVVVSMARRESILELEIDGEGSVEAICDRCLDAFPLHVAFCETLLVKIDAEKSEVVDENLIHVAEQEDSIDLTQFFYESVMLALPLRKVHPDGEGQACNPDMVKRLKPSKPSSKKKEVDPRWDALKNIKF